jgi:hypothetical protein
MHEFAVILKGTLPEYSAVERFVDSWIRYDSAQVPIYVIVPDPARRFFADNLADRAHVIEQSQLAPFIVSSNVDVGTADSVDEQIVILAVGELHLARHYLWGDPQALMLRQFDSADFFSAAGVPYVFVSEHAEARVSTNEFTNTRDAHLRNARRILELPSAPLRTCVSMQILSDQPLAELRDFWAGQGLTYETALKACPDAMSWYAFWLERTGFAGAVEREPIFKDLRSENALVDFFLKEETLADLARGYVGVVLDADPSDLEWRRDPRTRIIAERVDSKTLVKSMCTRWLRRAPRLQRLLARER